MRITKISDIYLSPIKVFVIFALFFGIIFIFLTPPYQVSDEDNHLYRAFQISELGIRGSKTELGPGGTLPKSLKDVKTSFDYLAQEHSHKVNLGVMKTGLSKPLDSDNKTPTSFPNTILYPPVAYIPQAIIIGILRLFGSPTLVLLYAARLFTFLAWFILVYAAIKITPVGKWAFCVLALMPMSLFSAASLSADAIINGLSFLSVALFFRYAMTKQVLASRDYLILFGVAIALSLCKPPCFLLAFLFLLLPYAKYGSKRNYWKFAVGLVLAVLVTMLAWSVVTRGLYANYRVTYDLANGQLIHVHQQALHIVQKPISYLAALYTTYFTAQGDARVVGYVGMLGWLTFLPLWTVILEYGLIAVALSQLPGQDDKKLAPLRRWQKISIAVIGIMSILAFSTLAYLTYTPVGNSIVDGVQGRYFIPISVLLVAFFAPKPKTKQLNYQKLCMWITIGMGTVLVTSVIVIFFRYYVHAVVPIL